MDTHNTNQDAQADTETTTAASTEATPPPENTTHTAAQDANKKKRGLFSRLFGKKPDSPDAPADTQQEATPAVADTIIEDDATEEDALATAAMDTSTPDAPSLADATIEKTDAPAADAANDEAETDAAAMPTAVAFAETAEAEAEAEKAKEDDTQANNLTTDDNTPAPKKKSWLVRLKEGLLRTSSKLTQGIADLFASRRIDDEALEELEDLLIMSDLGVETATHLSETLRSKKFGKDVTAEEVKAVLAEEVENILTPVAQPLLIDTSKKPFVILMVGVNGAGKTTTIGKMAKQFTDDGHKVMLAAGDTFRAAAVEQLKVWGDRTRCPVIAKDTGADAAGLAFDAYKTAQEQGMDVLMIDTAGRLQNKKGLMDELQKVVRVIKKIDDAAPHATMLVLDSTVGQNAHAQVDVFKQAVNISGLVMTKLDGTAKGGVVVALAQKFGLPVHYVGVGETAEDLRPFTAKDFAHSLMGIQETP
jgi:fused signal recognition particle receptor